MRSKRKKLSSTFPCKCGHAKKLHDFAGPPINDGWCNGEGNPIKYFSTRCGCSLYDPDNLKYLEQCLKKRKGKGKLK